MAKEVAAKVMPGTALRGYSISLEVPVKSAVIPPFEILIATCKGTFSLPISR